MTKAVLFDLDGTLADTAPDLAAALNHVLTQEGKPTLDPAIIRPYAAFGSAKLIELGFDKDHPNLDKLKEELLRYYEENIVDHTDLFEGMKEVLETLTARNIPTGIVTNKPTRFTEPLCHRLGLDHQVICIISGDTTPYSKPHPEPLLHASVILDIAPQDMLFVGDSNVDIEAGNNANVPVVYAEYGYQEEAIDPTKVFATISKPSELLTLI